MTKTYNDIDAVTRLLEEKERDLELAARIGQSLLKKNKTLTERNEYLEEQVEHIREEVSQLRHDLSMKDELLQFYTSAADESESDSICSTPNAWEFFNMGSYGTCSHQCFFVSLRFWKGSGTFFHAKSSVLHVMDFNGQASKTQVHRFCSVFGAFLPFLFFYFFYFFLRL
ncbi:hypothetical protein AB205_0092440, partial [Aquarana catesbeiana]